MRILLAHHFPLGQSETGRLVWHWASALAAAGDQVRLLVVDDEHRFGEPLAIERVVCGDDPNADLVFKLPRFSQPEDNGERPVFSSLSDAQLAQYRERLRRRLDAQVMQFDPHVIHAQHVWVLGQLALETGVPYVLSAWGPELVDCQADARFRALAEQAAENAGRIVAADETTKRQVELLFDRAGERTVVMPDALRLNDARDSDAGRAAAAHRLHALYQAVLDERFGQAAS
jgi:Glycosyl transferase 4-like domain